MGAGSREDAWRWPQEPGAAVGGLGGRSQVIGPRAWAESSRDVCRTTLGWSQTSDLPFPWYDLRLATDFAEPLISYLEKG